MMASKKNRWLYLLLVVFALFPYIQLIPLGTDSQPNALIVSLLIFLLTFKGKVDKIFWGLLLISFASICIFFIPPVNFGSVRSLSNYLGLFLVTYSTYVALSRLGGVPYKLFYVIVHIWFWVGTVQLFVYHDFLSFLIPRGDAEKLLMTGRGINGLTPEPTFYGLTCILLGMIAYINFKNCPKIKLVYLLLFIQLVFYSRSTLSIFILLGAFSIYYIIHFFRNADFIKSFLKISSLFLVLTVLVVYARDFIEQYRVGKLFLLMVENPQTFLIIDESVNERFIHLFFPVYAFITDFGIPHGFNTFGEYMQQCFVQPQFSDIITPHVEKSVITRILSGIGGTLYELGIFGFIFLLYLWGIFKKGLCGRTRDIMCILFLFIMANAMTFSNPMVAFLLGNIIYLGRSNEKVNCLNEDFSN